MDEAAIRINTSPVRGTDALGRSSRRRYGISWRYYGRRWVHTLYIGRTQIKLRGF
jgi:hypothetical protein